MLMLTCGALAVGGAAVSDVAHGGVWGFARVLRLEHAALAAQSANISCVASAVASLTMLAPTVEGEAACSASSRFVSRLRACTAASSATMALAAGAYAITGGLGGLGLRTASLLVEGGAVGVVLSSRSGRMGGRALEVATSAAKRVAACDIGDGVDGLALLAFALCLLYTSPSPRDRTRSRMPSSA